MPGAKVVSFVKEQSARLDEATEDELGQFAVLAEAIDDTEDGKEGRIVLEPAAVNGKRRIVVWVASGDGDDASHEPVAMLITATDAIKAEGFDLIQPGEAEILTIH